MVLMQAARPYPVGVKAYNSVGCGMTKYLRTLAPVQWRTFPFASEQQED